MAGELLEDCEEDWHEEVLEDLDEEFDSGLIEKLPYRDTLATLPISEELVHKLLVPPRPAEAVGTAAEAPTVSVEGWSEFAPSHPLPRSQYPEAEPSLDHPQFPPAANTGFAAGAFDKPVNRPSSSLVQVPKSLPSIIISEPPPAITAADAEARFSESPASAPSAVTLEAGTTSSRQSTLSDTIPPARSTQPSHGLRRRVATALLVGSLVGLASSWCLFPEAGAQAWSGLEAKLMIWWQQAKRVAWQ